MTDSYHPHGNAGRPTGTADSPVTVNGDPDSTSADLAIGVPGYDPRWHSRGYLPHFDSPRTLQHITYHLADSISQAAIQRLHSEIAFLPDQAGRSGERRSRHERGGCSGERRSQERSQCDSDAERRKRLEAWIDSGHGSCALRDPFAAGIVQASFLNFDAQRYRLLAWVVMPNHVHVLVEPINGWTVAKIVATWKKFTGRLINEHLTAERQKPLHPLWHREYWDRFMRDERHFEQTRAYIHNNPVKAGLVASPEQWPWSSAHTPEKALPAR